MTTRAMKEPKSIAKAQDGTYPRSTLIIAAIMANAITKTNKIEISDFSALEGVRSMNVV